MITSLTTANVSRQAPTNYPAAAFDNLCGEQLAELLAEVNAVAIRFRQRTRTLSGGRGDLAGAEHAALDIIARFGSATVPQIARERSTSRQNIQILVDRLEGEGQVELVSNPAHKRSALVRLTEQGRAWLEAGEQGQRNALLELGSRLPASELGAATSLLRKVHGLLSGEKQMRSDIQSVPFTSVSETVEPPDLSLRVEAEPEPEEFPINLL